MSDEIVVDYEAMLNAVRDEAEMWRTAKDRLAERCQAAEVERDALRAAIEKFVDTATRGPLALADEDVLMPAIRELGRLLGGPE